MSVLKLIQEYTKKVEECDKELKRLEDQLRLVRQTQGRADAVQQISHERIVTNSKRQIYFQMVKDLEDLV